VRPAPPRVAVRAALAARRALLRLADRLLPAELALFQHSIGIGRTHLLGALAELEVADALARGPATAAELADRLGLDADALHRVLRAAAVDGLVRLDRRGRFSLARLGQPLRADSPVSMRDWARYIARPSTAGAWAALAHGIRTGASPFAHVHGTSVWAWLAAHPDEERSFAGAMRRITEGEVPALVAGHPWPAQGTVCDVAGGVGTLLAAILRARPRLRGVLVEAPGVLAEAERHLARAGLRQRVELVAGDLHGKLSAEADVYVLKHVLHDWDDATGAGILRALRATMRPGARLVVIEQLQERNRPDAIASLVDVHMLTQCDGGRERSVAELHALLRAADLVPGPVRRTAGSALLEATAG
jgi:hypothetical protein